MRISANSICAESKGSIKLGGSAVNQISLVMVGMRHRGQDAVDFYRRMKYDKGLPSGFTLHLRRGTNSAYPKAVEVIAKKHLTGTPIFLGHIKEEQANYIHKYLPGHGITKVHRVHSIREFYSILEVNVSEFSIIDDGYDPNDWGAVMENDEAKFREELTEYGRIKKAEVGDFLDRQSEASIAKVINQTPKQPTEKENIMSAVNTVIDKNVVVAQAAAFLEAGRIANNQVTKLVASKAPLMVKGYVETPFGKLLIANAASIAAEKLRPGDVRLNKLAKAMMTEAWQEVYQTLDFEKMIDEMLSSASIKAALNKLDSAPAVAE